MALKQSKQVLAGLPAPTATEASRPVIVTGEYVTVAGDAINDIVEFGAIPQNCVPVDLIVDNGALGASATLDAGVISHGDADHAGGLEAVRAVVPVARWQAANTRARIVQSSAPLSTALITADSRPNSSTALRIVETICLPNSFATELFKTTST